MAEEALLEQDFGLVADLIRAHGQNAPARPALIQGERTLGYGELDQLLDRIARTLQSAGFRAGDVVAICAKSSLEYAAVFLGALRAGVIVAPLPPSATAVGLAGMLEDCGARLFFVDQTSANTVPIDVEQVTLDGSPGAQTFDDWLTLDDARPEPVMLEPDAPFNIIYSSGTTGAPKGIVQSHGMRWAHVRRAMAFGYDSRAVTMISTPLYSNTTLVSFFPALAAGGACVLLDKFDARKFLELAEQHRATHAMLVPVQYQRLMATPYFNAFDLASFRMKFCTSAPFPAALKADILARWPGGLVEYYGMTEGGGTCLLVAHEHPTKLHTVGRPAPGHDIRLIDEHDAEVAQGEVGEVVGRSTAMMNGYFKQPTKTAEVEWYDEHGNRFIRTGDIGRFDEDGFLTLLDRKKDMLISGGFNVYPSDVEAALLEHEALSDAAVIGVPSPEWGETPVAFVVLKEGRSETADEIRLWLNGRVSKIQRLSALHILSSLPRNSIGKVLKRELRDHYSGATRRSPA